MNNTYYERKAQGLCVQCGKNPAAPDHVCCEECMAKNREKQKQRYAEHGNSPKRKAYNTSWVRKKREIRRRDGRCVICGAPRMEGSKCYCEKCHAKVKAYTQQRRAKQIAEMMDSV